jgi:hypothetical protein
MMNVEIQLLKPEFGKNYDIGYVGFTFQGSSVVSKGISYFTRWEDLRSIPVSHALIVTGDNQCIEAVGTTDSVRIVPLTHYFEEPGVRISFRQPVGWTKELGQRIAATAELQNGAKYDFGLMVADFISNSIPGHFLNRIFHNKPAQALAGLLDNPHKFICSELVAWALDQQPEFKGKGSLVHPAYLATPQELFEDEVIFDAWKHS